jgi:hypothetical protein
MRLMRVFTLAGHTPQAGHPANAANAARGYRGVRVQIHSLARRQKCS